jgi:hypothetical protein
VRRSTGGDLLLDDDLFLLVGVLSGGVGVGVVVVVTVRVDGVGYTFGDLVGDLVCGVVGGVTQRVVLTFVVVISHRKAVTLGGLGGGTSRRLYSDLRITLVDAVLVLGSEGLAGDTRFLDNGAGALTELTFGNVNLSGCVVGGRAVNSVEVTVVGAVLDVDVGVGVRRLGREAVKLARLVLGLTVELRLSALGLAVADLLVDVDVFADRLLLGAAALFFVDADLFLDVSLAGRLLVLVLVDGGREGFVRLFVTFPSVCLRLR